MISPIDLHRVPAHTAVHIVAPATAVSTKLEKDTVYMPSNVAARLLGRASQDSPGAVTVQPGVPQG